MKPDTQLEFAIFQLTPTRTRCELYICGGGITEKLASGLVQPFLDHLRTAEEQIARGGYSIRLEPPDPNGASWFTKGTMERFVRFVSTPEVLERVSTVEMELIQLEEAMGPQVSEQLKGEDQNRKTGQSAGLGNMISLSKIRRDSIDGGEHGIGENSKMRLLRALDARCTVLQKEQGMAFARAAAAGFGVEEMADLVAFAQCFGAARLREACIKFTALCKKKQEAGLWFEEMDLTTVEATSTCSNMYYVEVAGETGMGTHTRVRDYQDTWSDVDCEDVKLDGIHEDVNIKSQGGFLGECNASNARSSMSQAGKKVPNGPGRLVGLNGEYVPFIHTRTGSRQVSGRNQMTVEDMSGRMFVDEGFLVNENLHVPQSLATEYPDSLQRNTEGMGTPGDLLGKGEYNDADLGRTLGALRGHPAMTSWQSRSQQFMTGVIPHSKQDSVHLPAQNTPLHMQKFFEPPYGFGGPVRGPPSGSYYPHYMGHPSFLQADGNVASPWRPSEASPNWAGQVQCAPSQHCLGSQGSGDSMHLDYQQYPTVVAGGSQQHEASSSQRPAKEVSEVLYDGRERQIVMQTPPKFPSPKVDTPLSENAVGVEDNQSNLYKDDQSPFETRRLSQRSASPRRRSPSPMRRVQIGRLGPRRSGMVVIRNINYIASNSQDQLNKKREDGNGTESPGSGSEESDSSIGGKEEMLQSKVESVRVRVQDVIGLFENNQKDSSEIKKKLSKHESHRKSSRVGKISKKAVRKSNSGDLTVETSPETHEDAGPPLHDGTYIQKEHTSGEILGYVLEDEGKKETNPHADETAFFPEQLKWTLQKSNCNIVDLESEANSCCKISSQHRQVAEEDLLVLTRQEEASENRYRSDLLSLPDSEVTREVTGSRLQWHNMPEEGQKLPDRDGVDRRSETLYGLEMLSEQQGFVPLRRQRADDSFVVSDRPTEGDYSAWQNHSVDHNLELVTSQIEDSFCYEQQQDKKSIDDSFILPARTMVQDQAISSWRTNINVDSEIIGDENIGANLKDICKSDSLEPVDRLLMPDRHMGRESIGRFSNSGFDYDAQCSVDVANGKCQDHDQQSVLDESRSPNEDKGQLYDKYSEKTDARLKETPASMRAEKEAKLKAMQEVLEKRKAEVARNRRSEKLSPLAEAQMRAEKIRAYKASLQKSKKEKEEEERKQLEELIAQRRGRIAARNSPSTASTKSTTSTPCGSRSLSCASKTSLASKLSPLSQKSGVTPNSSHGISQGISSSLPKTATLKNSNGMGVPPSLRRLSKASIQSNTENSVSRSLPSLIDPHKESNGSSALRASTGSQRMTLQKTNNQLRSLKSTNDSPVNSNGWVEDKLERRNGSLARKGSTTDTELKGEGLPQSKGTMNMGKHPKKSKNVATTVSKDIKPASQKASGTRSTGTLKQSLTDGERMGIKAVPPKCLPDDYPPSSLPKQHKDALGENMEVTPNVAVVESFGLCEADERAVSGSGSLSTGGHWSLSLEADAANTETDAEKAVVAGENMDKLQEATGVSDIVSESTLTAHNSEQPNEGNASTVPMVSSPNSSPMFYQDVDGMQSPHNDEAGIKYHASIGCASLDPTSDSLQDLNANSSPFVAISPNRAMLPHSEVYNPLLSHTMGSPVNRPLLQNHLHLEESVTPVDSPKADINKARKRWGSSEKSSSVGPQSNEHAKGLKRLLKFGRKSSHSPGHNMRDWVSVSNSDGDEDTDDSRDLAFRIVENQGSQAGPSIQKSSQSRASANERGCDKDSNGFDKRRTSPRSFFSLSSFRSKGGERKSR
eukprot:c27817_g1_i4 orf=381-5711(-)